MSARDVRNFLQNLISAKGNEKIYEVLRTGPSTLTLLRENTSANSVSISTIQRTPPTPLLGSGNGPAMLFGYEKSDEALISSGDPNLVLSLAMPLVPTRNIADLEAEMKATLEAMMDGPKDKSGNEVAADGATAAQSHEEGDLRSIPLKRLYKDLPGSTSAQADNYEESRLQYYQSTGDSDPAPAPPKPFRGGKKKREPNKPAEPNRKGVNKKNRKPNKPAEPNRTKPERYKPKRMVPTRNLADLEAKRKVKSGNEVAADGATAAQSHEEGAFRSLPLKGPYKDLPGSTSAQADNYDESKLEYYQLTSDSDPAPAPPKPFRGGKKNREPNKPAEPNRTKPERGEQKNRKPNRTKPERYKSKRKVKSGNEVAADGATAAQSHEEGAFEADNNEKVKKTLLERIWPYVLLTILLVGGIVVAYFCSRNASHVKMFNEKANDVYQNVWASSPCISFSPRIALFNIEIGTSEGQGWRKAG